MVVEDLAHILVYVFVWRFDFVLGVDFGVGS